MTLPETASGKTPRIGGAIGADFANIGGSYALA